MTRKKAEENEVKSAKTTKKAAIGAKQDESGAKSAKSTTRTPNSGAKSAKSGAKTGTKAALKSPKKDVSKATKESTNSINRRKTPEIAAESADMEIFDAAARLETMEEEARTEAVLGSNIGMNEPSPKIIYSLKAGVQIFVKTADIVAATGKTTSWIRDITARGIIKETKTKHGHLYDFVQTMRAYCSSLEARRSDDDTADVELKKKKAEAKLKESKAAIADMQAKEFQGKMHRSEDVQKMTADLLYFVRGGLMALAGRCANDCAASPEPAVVQKIIDREVREILKDLSEYKYDPKRYDELVRQRTNRELDADFEDGDEEE